MGEAGSRSPGSEAQETEEIEKPRVRVAAAAASS